MSCSKIWFVFYVKPILRQDKADKKQRLISLLYKVTRKKIEKL